ncbi:Hypothetical predicted protein [Paramuricea clavata]|uniref:Uncharacterized protein n=1 Tax=Paramuricea clavata TaxID=317549 RepID=A0A6S7GRX6_PARCT|nr:Hypothetical predicted protein [Paramuricea clavata]
MRTEAIGAEHGDQGGTLKSTETNTHVEKDETHGTKQRILSKQKGLTTAEEPSRIILVPIPEPTMQPAQPNPAVPTSPPIPQPTPLVNPVPNVQPKTPKPTNPVQAVLYRSNVRCARNSMPTPKPAIPAQPAKSASSVRKPKPG